MSSEKLLKIGGVVVVCYLLWDVLFGKSEEMTAQQKLEEETDQTVRRLMSIKRYGAAMLESCHSLFDLIRSKSGVQNLDGYALIKHVFEGDEPLLKFTRHAEYPTVKNSGKGNIHLLKGVVSTIRNPLSHARIEMTKREASRQIALMKHLYIVIRDHTIRVSQDKK